MKYKIMEQESGVYIVSLKVDGEVANNNFLMQFQSGELEELRNEKLTGWKLAVRCAPAWAEK